MSNLTDRELRVELDAIGDSTPITATTRPILIKKLMRHSRNKKPVVSLASRRTTRNSFQSSNCESEEDELDSSQEQEDSEDEEVSFRNNSVSSFTNRTNKGSKSRPSLTPSRTSTPTSRITMPTRLNGSESKILSAKNTSKNNTPNSSKLFPAINFTSQPSLRKQKYENCDSASDSDDPYSSRKLLRCRRSLANRSHNGSLFSNNFSNVQYTSCEDSAVDGSLNSSKYQTKDYYTKNGKPTIMSNGLFNNLFSSKSKVSSGSNVRPSFIGRRWKNLKNLLSEYLNFGIPAILLILLLSFLAFVGVTYIRMLDSANFPLVNSDSSILGKKLKAGDLQFPICSENPNENVGVCLSHDEISLARQVLPAGSKLTQEILHRSDEYQCGFHKLNYITHDELVKKLKSFTNINDSHISTAVSSIAKLATVNPSLQLEPLYDETSKVFIGMKTRKPRLKLACAFMNVVYVLLYVVALFGLGLVVFYAVLSIVRRWQHKKAAYRQKLMETATRAIEVIQSVDEVPVDHVRDQLFTIQYRISSSKLWADVVDFIEQHESRVVKELGTVGGEDCEIWRWNGKKVLKKEESDSTERRKETSSIYPSLPTVDDSECPEVGNGINSDWQGNALSRTDKVNPPTRYLKIRNLPTDIQSASYVKKALISKCEGLPMLHIVVDDNSSEGIVYLKTDTVRTAGKIYSLLHGAWFAGQLLSVKFLRSERYEMRFPSSIDCTEPLTADYSGLDEF